MTIVLRKDLPDLRVIISGGQTGADRGGLDAAIELGLEHGGWCPHGRLAEDGVIPEKYQLRETGTAQYGERTALNVRDSTATLLVSLDQRLTGGSAKTLSLALKKGRPALHVTLSSRHDVSDEQAEAIRRWLARHSVGILNVAGPRESKEPGLQEAVRDMLVAVLGQVHEDAPAESPG